MNGSIIELFISIKAIAGGGLAEFAESAKKSLDKVQNYVVNTNKKLDILVSKFQTLNKALPDVEKSMKKTFEGKGLKNAVKDMGDLQKAADKVANTIAKMPAVPAAVQQATSGTKKTGGPGRFKDQAKKWTAAALSSVVTMVPAAMTMAQEYNAARDNVITLAHNSKDGNALAGGLDQMAENTLLGKGVFKTAADLETQGVKANRVLPVIKAFGDISGGDEEKMGSLTSAYGAVQQSGKLDDKSLGQFRQGNFDPIHQIATSMHMDDDSVMKKFKQGAIGIDMINIALQDSTKRGGEFYDGLAKAADTPEGKIKLLEQWFEMLQLKVGQALLPVMDLVGDVAGFLLDNKELIFAAAAAWATYTIVTQGAALAQQGLTIATELWNAVMMINPIALIIALIVGMIVWIAALSKKYEGWGQMLQGLWEIIKGFVAGAVIGFRDLVNWIGYYLQLGWLKLVDFGERAMQFAKNVAKALKLALAGHGEEARQLLTAEIKTEAQGRIEELDKKRQEYLTKTETEAKAASDKVEAGKKLLGTGYVNRWKEKPGSKDAASVDAGSLTDKTNMQFSPQDAAKNVGKEVTSGGPRVININGVRFADKIEIHVNALEEGLNQLEDRMGQLYLRILNSGAKMQ